MAETYYVATDQTGTGREGDLEWHLVLGSDGASAEVDPSSTRVALANTAALLDRLDELIFVAEPGEGATPLTTGLLAAERPRLLGRTGWDTRRAAEFALDCAEHVLDDSADVKLPSGATLAAVVADARRFLEHAEDDTEGRLARLAILATARRLRRSGEQVGDLARAILSEDVSNELDAEEDPAWSLAAALVDAVLAAVEALRHLALPRYVTEREEVAGERDEHSSEQVVPRFYTSPWGNFAVGAEHESPYMPAAHLAREAAFRARQSILERVGADAAESEAAWQEATLATLLGS